MSFRSFLPRVWNRVVRGGRRERPARFVARSYRNGAGTRKYKTYIPALYDGQALPLVVMLHGCKQTPDDFAAGTRMNELADELGFFVVYPAQSAMANVQRCWNWFKPVNRQRDAGEPAVIAGITRKVIARYNIDPRRVYVAGLSAGGTMAAIMAKTYPELFAGAGIHSGVAYGSASDAFSAAAAMRGRDDGVAHELPVPTIVFHGDEDETVHPSNAERLIARLKAAVVQTGRAAGRAYTRTLLEAEDGAGMEHWLVHGAGHAWSGGNASGSFADPLGPDATREMLRFFGIAPR